MKTEVFEYDDVIVQRKGCFRISIVLAFSRGWAKTNRMHDGWTHKKNSVFEIIRILVDEANIKKVRFAQFCILGGNDCVQL